MKPVSKARAQRPIQANQHNSYQGIEAGRCQAISIEPYNKNANLDYVKAKASYIDHE